MPIEKEPTPSMESIVWEEIKRHFQKQHPEWSTALRVDSYCNNFSYKMPGRDGISSAEMLLSPEKLKEKRAKRPFRFDEHDKGELTEIRKQGYSDKFTFQTYQQFLDDIEQAIIASGVDRENLYQFIDKEREKVRKGAGPFATDKEMVERAEVVKQYFLPVFIKLREMGYSLQDLRG